jgi:tetratricopeptide (TPR) repeat protein
VKSNPEIALSDVDWYQITALIRKAQFKGRAGETKGAIDDLTEILRLAPEQPSILIVLADQYSRLGAYSEAAQALQVFQRLEPEDANGYILMGRALLASRDVDGALLEFRTAITFAPESLESLNNVAWILATHNDAAVRNPQEAIAFAERAAKLTANNNPGVLDTLAAAYASGGRFEEAISVQQRVIGLAIDLNAGGLEAQAREHLRLYQRNQPILEAG